MLKQHLRHRKLDSTGLRLKADLAKRLKEAEAKERLREIEKAVEGLDKLSVSKSVEKCAKEKVFSYLQFELCRSTEREDLRAL